MSDEIQVDAPARSEPAATPSRPWYRRLTLALSAFIMSVTIALINAFYAVRGPEIVVPDPTEILLYRDGEGDRAILMMAIKVSMINAADGGHGDVLLDGTFEPRIGGPAFRNVTTINPVLTDLPNAAERCDLGSRCISLPGLLVMERPDQILDLPGGAARVHYLAFAIAPWNCAEGSASCDGHGNFDRATRALGNGQADMRVRLRFHGDGVREIICSGGTVNVPYLRQVGWTSNAGARCRVSGDPWL